MPAVKTTLKVDSTVMTALRREAARRGCTMSELMEAALRLMLQPKPKAPKLPKLPAYNSGGYLVDIADRDALYDAMEER